MMEQNALSPIGAQAGRLRCVLSVRIAGRSVFFGPGPCRLLELVGETGSLEAAAQGMEMSYTKARKMVKSIESELGFPVVIRHPGGTGGGSSRLTEEGRLLVQSYTRFAEAVGRDVETLLAENFAEIIQRARQGQQERTVTE